MRSRAIPVLLTLLLAACGQPTDQGQQSSPQPSVSPTQQSTATPSPTPAGSTVVMQQAASATPLASTSPLASSSPGALPAASPPSATVAPGATLAPGTSVVSAPSATPQRAVLLPPDAPPQIVDLHLDKTVVQTGETVSGTVRTSSNVASVEARIANFSISVPKTGEGRFALSYTVPNLPFFLKKTYDMVVIARNTAGAQTQRVVPITIH